MADSNPVTPSTVSVAKRARIDGEDLPAKSTPPEPVKVDFSFVLDSELIREPIIHVNDLAPTALKGVEVLGKGLHGIAYKVHFAGVGNCVMKVAFGSTEFNGTKRLLKSALHIKAIEDLRNEKMIAKKALALTSLAMRTIDSKVGEDAKYRIQFGDFMVDADMLLLENAGKTVFDHINSVYTKDPTYKYGVLPVIGEVIKVLTTEISKMQEAEVFVHNDLHGDNICLDREKKLRMIDFGRAQIARATHNGLVASNQVRFGPTMWSFIHTFGKRSKLDDKSGLYLALPPAADIFAYIRAMRMAFTQSEDQTPSATAKSGATGKVWKETFPKLTSEAAYSTTKDKLTAAATSCAHPNEKFALGYVAKILDCALRYYNGSLAPVTTTSPWTVVHDRIDVITGVMLLELEYQNVMAEVGKDMPGGGAASSIDTKAGLPIFPSDPPSNLCSRVWKPDRYERLLGLAKALQSIA